MSIQEVAPEELAKLFHRYHQALASDFDCRGNSHSEAWEQMPVGEKKRLVAAVRLALLELSSTNVDQERSRYFAKPGKAEWGC